MKERRMAKVLFVAVLGALALGVGVAHAVTTQPSLQGEDLFTPVEGFSATSSCNTAATSTVSWTAQGVASGPYPGTFTASGTMTIGPQTLPGNHPPVPNREGTVAGPVQSFQESFTINSGTTTVTGTKTLDPQAASGNVGTCQHVTQFPVLDFFDGQGTVFEANVQARYQAQINGPTTSTTDSGVASVALSELDITGSCPAGPSCQARIGGFDQVFSLSDAINCDEETVTQEMGEHQTETDCETVEN